MNKWLVKRDQDMELIGVHLCLLKIVDNTVGVPTDEYELLYYVQKCFNNVDFIILYW